ncbi:hypothetical protein CVT25_005402 [Psilocybe cyanescens]|uniref:Carbonic anhydrase n=1 Tax=Psilocybe cyanescens TaxID=93625 RepID=A0A409WXC2_PSICY|nr:hypothetical protein CVT25_005402 [Psilocybe cyanescens]
MSEQNPGVSEQYIFSAQPGTIFTAGNVANRFDEQDPNSNVILSFAVEALKVKHVVVMGHYGCGGVAESMMPVKTPLSRPADVLVQGRIQPIQEIYQTSTQFVFVFIGNSRPSRSMQTQTDESSFSSTQSYEYISFLPSLPSLLAIRLSFALFLPPTLFITQNQKY